MGGFVCECSDVSCAAVLTIPLDVYDRVRRHGARFVVAADDAHVDGSLERVVERHSEFWIVEKLGLAGDVAEALDEVARRTRWASSSPRRWVKATDDATPVHPTTTAHTDGPGRRRMITILEGSTFCLSDDDGQIASGLTGLFADDTRFLSQLELTIDGARPLLLGAGNVEYFNAAIFLRNAVTPTLPGTRCPSPGGGSSPEACPSGS